MIIEIRGDRAVVEPSPQTKIDSALFSVVGELEGSRRWLTNGGLSFDASGHNLDVFQRYFPDVDFVSATEPAIQHEFDLGSTPTAYQSKTVAYDHQAEAMNKMRNKTNFALFMEQGTGKTKCAIDRAGQLFVEGKITAMLVVSKKGVHRQWVDSEIPTHLGLDYDCAFWPTKNKQLPSELTSLDAGFDGYAPLKVFAINFDAIKTKHGKVACIEFVKAHLGKVLIVADETQQIKNARSARWKALDEITKISRSPYRLALTGTPIAKDLTDEWAQLKWLNEDIIGIRYISAFRNEYCVMGGYEGRVVISHKNVDKFKQKVEPYSYRATKDQIGILPKGYKKWNFDLSSAQKSAIRSLRKELMHQIDSGEIVSAANAAVAMLKIQQASNGFAVDEEGSTLQLVDPSKNPRLNALLEYLNSRDGRIIIWARFREDIRLIEQMLKDEMISFASYHGGTSDKERAEAVRSFMDPWGCRVFLSNPQAGGTGLNLQGACTESVYYSNSYNAIDRWQSEDRIHRIGTKGAVTYTDLIAKGSIDAAILNNLKKKKSISSFALGDIRNILQEVEL